MKAEIVPNNGEERIVRVELNQGNINLSVGPPVQGVRTAEMSFDQARQVARLILVAIGEG